MLKALQFKSGSRDAFNIFSPYDLFIFPINYTTVSEEHCENIHVYDRVIIRWHKKLRRNDKEIKAKKILRYFFRGEKCEMHRAMIVKRAEKLLSAD
jgi:hypothetical protein